MARGGATRRRRGRSRRLNDLQLVLTVAIIAGMAAVLSGIWQALLRIEQDPRLLLVIALTGLVILGLAFLGALIVRLVLRGRAEARLETGYRLKSLHTRAQRAEIDFSGSPDSFDAPRTQPPLTVTDPLLPSAVSQDVGRFKSLRDLQAVRGLDLEVLASDVYKLLGWGVVARGGPVPDGGVDLELHKSRERIVVQCKRWTRDLVGVELIRALAGVMHAEHATGAVFVTTSTFTEQAISWGRAHGITLVDGPGLLALIRSVEPKVQIELRGSSPPTCDLCGSSMRVKNGRYGLFWSCNRFPTCSGTRSMRDVNARRK
jgi:hypothetical protein